MDYKETAVLKKELVTEAVEKGLDSSDQDKQIDSKVSGSSSYQSELPNNSNSNNSNVEDSQSCPMKFKTLNGAAYHKGSIEVTLEGKSLWDEFYRRGTEMIVNRAGRRMFPGFSVAISSLKPKVKYSMKLEVVLADNHRFKFLNSRWLAVGSAEPQPLTESYVHPDSPNSGAFWMRHGVSFRKLKITNNKEKPGNNALLYSMHKYFLRLIVEERKLSPGEERLSAKIVLKVDFPETTFVAVTAYQNEEVTQLKITNNPFAKAFRENTADMDWETAQMLYSNQGVFSPLPTQQHSDHLANHSCWTFPSPATPTSLPLSGFIAPTSSGCFPPPPRFPFSPASPSVPSPYYFQWPGVHQQITQSCPSTNPHYNMYHKVEVLESPAYASSFGANLPDFETVFTTLSN